MSDTERFVDSLYEKYYEDLVKEARRRTGDWALAEDMVQSTMETALKNIDKVRESASIKGWLIKTLKFKLTREFDKAYRKHEVTSEDENIMELLKASSSEPKSLTLEGLDEILPVTCPPHFREILYLRYVEDILMEKNSDSSVEEMRWHGFDYLIVKNVDTVTCEWEKGGYSYSVSGNISADELKSVVKSFK